VKWNFLSYFKPIIALMVSTSVLFTAQNCIAAFNKGKIKSFYTDPYNEKSVKLVIAPNTGESDIVVNKPSTADFDNFNTNTEVEYDINKRGGIENLKKVDRSVPP